MMKMAWIGAVIFFMAVTSQAGVRNYSVLEGKVVDDQGRPLANQPVYLELPKGPIVAFTDARGVFQFFNLSPGEYTLFVKGGSRVSVRFRDPKRVPSNDPRAACAQSSLAYSPPQPSSD